MHTQPHLRHICTSGACQVVLRPDNQYLSEHTFAIPFDGFVANR